MRHYQVSNRLKSYFMSSSGSMTAPNGKVIANVVPWLGGETGVVDKNNNLQIESSFSLSTTRNMHY